MTGATDFVPPAAEGLPEGVLDSAVAGACVLDAWAGTDYGRNVLAHALVQLQRDGWLRDSRAAEPEAPESLKAPYRMRLHNGRNVHGARPISSGLVTTCRQYLSGPGDHQLADDTLITCKACLRELES